MKTHINYKYECGDCSKTFVKESYLIRHQLRIHGGNSKEEENIVQNMGGTPFLSYERMNK